MKLFSLTYCKSLVEQLQQQQQQQQQINKQLKL